MLSIKNCVIVLIFATVVTCTPSKSNGSPADTYQLTDFLELKKNGYESNVETGRSEAGLEDILADNIKSYDATFKFPIIGSVTIDGRSLDQDELNLKVTSSDTNSVEERGKKHKLKKIFVPLFIIVLLKVITLIPLALGILGLKTWNALQLSFVTFVISISMAVYNLCKKITADSHPPIATHGPWDHYHKRSFDDFDAQKLVYNTYTP